MKGTKNLVILIGRLGKDPEFNVSKGTKYAKLSVATINYDGSTEWHRVTVFQAAAEFASEFLHKGSHVYVAGSIATSSFEDEDGNTVYVTGVRAFELISLDKKEAKPESKSNKYAKAKGKPARKVTAADYEGPDDDVTF